MTNLQRWLFYFSLFIVPYLAITLEIVKSPFPASWMFQIQITPIVLIAAFGIYSASTVIYRTLTFNDCPAAAKELQEQIQEARRDLIANGFKFRD